MQSVCLSLAAKERRVGSANKSVPSSRRFLMPSRPPPTPIAIQSSPWSASKGEPAEEDGVGSKGHRGGDWNVFYLFLYNTVDFSEVFT